MAEIEELRAKAIASMACSQKKSPKNKEEGEFSSSENNDEIPTCSSADAVAAPTVASSPVEPSAALMSRSNKKPRIGDFNTKNKTTSSADIRPKTYSKQNYSKALTRSSAPSTHGNHFAHAWYAPPVQNNNLVICFSDDDSGSDSQEPRLDKPSKRKEIGFGVERSPVRREPLYTPKSAHNQMKRRPKTVSVNRTRTFVSSLTKIHGANSRGSGPSLAEQVNDSRNSDPLNNTSASQEHEVNSGKNLKSSKLEVLRQQIAIKENQLNLRPAQQRKNPVSGLYHDHSDINLKSNAAKKCRPASSNTIRLDELEKKRLKIGHSQKKSDLDGEQKMLRLASGNTTGLNELEKKRLKIDSSQKKSDLDGEQKMLQPATKFESNSRVPPPGKMRLKDANPMTPSQVSPKITLGRVDLITDKQLTEVGNQIPDLSGNLVPRVKSGECSMAFHENNSSKVTNIKLLNKHSGYTSDISSICFQSDKSNNLTDLSAELNPRSLLAPMASRGEDGGECCLRISSPNKSAYPSKTIIHDVLGQMSLIGHQHATVQSLAEMEESYDKELEEAQECRHRCELEERNALKAYRVAQRALVEANARCSYLYRKRELFSAQFQAFMMEEPGSVWPSMWNKHPNDGSDDIAPEDGVDHLPASGHQTPAEFEALNDDSNTQPTDGAMVHTSCQQMMGHNVVSEPCKEPDASTSELLHFKDSDAVTGVCPPSNHANMSADEDEESFAFARQTAESTVVQEDVENCENGDLDLNNDSERVDSIDNAEGYALLEASLRSELFERLKTKNISKKKNQFDGAETITNDGIACLVENKGSEATMSNRPHAESGEKQISNIRGIDGSQRNINWHLIQADTLGFDEKLSEYNFHGIVDPDGRTSTFAEACGETTADFSLPSPVIKLAFSYVKVTPQISSRRVQKRSLEKCVTAKEESGLAHSELLLGVLGENLRGNMGKVGYYACDFSIDPSWPLCMFELRGKCNDEECIWQHVKDHSGRNTKQYDSSKSADCEVAQSSDTEKFSGACNISPHQKHIISAPPTYIVGLDLLKGDLRTSESVLPQSRCWQKAFSTSSTIPFTIQRTLFQNDASSYRHDGHCRGQGSRSRQSLNFHSQDDSLKQTGHNLDDPEQCLDMALVLFNGNINKSEGMTKARIMLSRALEANPTSVALWIVYLHIHYRNETTIGKDDMFSHAVHYNDGSYELWLMYIKSRVQLADHLEAYDTAISALCRHASSPNVDRVHASTCILDLFLQLVDCLCMSGDVGNAIQRISGLLPAATEGANDASILLSDIVACLTVSDKCIFWICCVYIVIYKKLPDTVVQQLESKKGLQFVAEWPSVQLAAAEKHTALELIKMGVDSVALSADMYEREVHFLYASHVQCVAALKGIECSKNLLDRYIKVYPTCLELVLISARLHRYCFADLGFEGFEDALRNWPKEMPGVQCVWNQYAQCAVENGELDYAEKLMVRWFESVWKVDCPQSGILAIMEDDGFYHSPDSLSPKSDFCFTFTNPKDELFGLLNLSLHRLLQNDQVKARSAIDRALKVASLDDFMQCVREHAAFISYDVLDPREDEPSSWIMNLLNIYINDIRGLPVSEPLSRKFCGDIRRPRIRQMTNNLLGPVPCSCFLINSVLESWYGPPLLPEKCDLKALVNLVETLMEFYPANYLLALAACKWIIRKFTSSGNGSASTLFWASSLLVNSIYHAFPVAPEHRWVEVADILSNLAEAHGISESFYQRALSVHPFSFNLWKSYYSFSKKRGDVSLVVQTARGRGIKLE